MTVLTPARGRAALHASAAATVLALAWCGAASAQQVQLPEKRFAADVRASVTHDSNISGGNPLFAAVRTVQPEDTISTLGGSVQAKLPVGRQNLFINASTDVVRYDKNSQLDNTNIQATGGVIGRIGPCADTGVVGYNRQLTPGYDLVVAVSKNIMEETTFSLGATCTRGHFVVGLYGEHLTVDNSAQDHGLLNYHSDSVSATAGYAQQVLGSISLLARTTKVDYDIPASLTTPTLSHYQTYEFGVRYFRRVGLRLSGTADFTYTHVKAGDFVNLPVGFAPQTSYSDWSGDVQMNYRLTPTTNLDLLLSHAVSPAEVVGSGFNVSDSGRINATHHFGRRLLVSVGASTVRTNYGKSELTTLLLTKDHVTTFYGSAGMDIGQHIRVSLDAQHLDRKADTPVFTYKSDRIGITLAAHL